MKTETFQDSKQKCDEFARWLKFETFGDPELEKVALGAMQWGHAWLDKRSPRWLSLLGSSGSGKTHVCQRLFFYVAKRSNFQNRAYKPHVVYWPDFVQTLRSQHGYEKRQDLKEWPVLFLDDIGAERDTTGFATEELHTLLGCRIGKWTLITSNKSFEALEQLDARITSRLVRDNNICVGITTKDFSER